MLLKAVVQTINARDDSLTTGKSMFRSCRNDKRCIVIAEGYYEWLTPKSGGKKIPHYVRREDGNLMFFAALYDHVKLDGGKDSIYSCTIVTTSCSKQLSFLHDRMPVIFDSSSKEVDTWLDNTKPWDNATLGTLLKPYEKKLACYPVTPEVGRVGKNSPDFVIPISEKKGTLGSFFAKANSDQSSKRAEATSDNVNVKTEDVNVNLHEQKPLKPDDTNHKIDNMDEEGHNAKQEDDDIQRAIALSLQDQKDHYEANSNSSIHGEDNRGTKREVEESLSPPRAKFRRSDPAKQMKSPSKSPAKGGGDKGNSNKKITSFFSKD
ncbi:hypothetical protein K450DRAFT_218889 [Umbelopsis ramanniana AG]|uniref:Embryonic stem cell-specific 5-hydroxymethylcytosine-binding protein n=1 Tax=Umbelopsis ramanniana AG TaxID=1314678 RepID=A0AAD5HH45_UMBRA|nr:uncharacterized protein K450DRAFT_218889 [Umbelopsis ramanniana AG]KAI8584252.1 hypothetical protein K450DRAFT_218889 [Umbelopsis ramanniana AG]